MFVVLLAGAMTVQARISETKEQILKRFGGWEAVSSVYTLNGQDVMMFRHKNVAYIYFNSNGQSELEIYHLSTRFNKSDAYEIIRTVIGGRPPFDETQVHSLCWESVNGVYKVAMMNRDALPHNYQWGIAVGRSAAVERFVSWAQEKRREIVQPRPTEQPRYCADPSRTPNDCSIVASKAYHELKDTSSWCQVISAGLNLAECWRVQTLGGRVQVSEGRSRVHLRRARLARVRHAAGRWRRDQDGVAGQTDQPESPHDRE